MKEDLKIKGYVEAYRGIPKELINRHGEKLLSSIHDNNKIKSISKYITDEGPLRKGSNIVTNFGKDFSLERMFGSGSIFENIAVGDGGFSFDSSGNFISPPRFPKKTDTILQNQVSGKKIDLVGDIIKRGENGVEVSLITTFFSDQDVQINSTWNPNNSNFYINEVGLSMTENSGVYSDFLSIFILGNQILSPLSDSALTVEWKMRFY